MMTMKNKDRRPHCLVTDYYDKGWLDLDAVLEAISNSGNDGRLLGEALNDSATERIERKRSQILAGMELVGVSDAVKEAMRTGYYTEEQMDALHDIWIREMQKSCVDQMSVSEKLINSRRWRDFAAFRNGVRTPRVRDHNFARMGKRISPNDNMS
jgi:hypothetical protein